MNCATDQEKAALLREMADKLESIESEFRPGLLVVNSDDGLRITTKNGVVMLDGSPSYRAILHIATATDVDRYAFPSQVLAALQRYAAFVAKEGAKQ